MRAYKRFLCVFVAGWVHDKIRQGGWVAGWLGANGRTSLAKRHRLRSRPKNGGSWGKTNFVKKFINSGQNVTKNDGLRNNFGVS